MAHAFVSYVRENQRKVDKLCADLNLYGVETWIDRSSLRPGERWRTAIRNAIRDGAAFIACFSPQFEAKSRTYMHEELVAAITELRMRTTDYAWFIPVLLGPCKIPDRDIGAGESLRDIQHVKLYRNWRDGIRSILETISRLPGVNLEYDMVERLDGLFDALDKLRSNSEALWNSVNESTLANYADSLSNAMDQLLVAAPAIDSRDQTRLSKLLRHSFNFEAGKKTLVDLRNRKGRLVRVDYERIQCQINRNRSALKKFSSILYQLEKRYKDRHI